jgi:hypothetical protein
MLKELLLLTTLVLLWPIQDISASALLLQETSLLSREQDQIHPTTVSMDMPVVTAARRR